MYILQISKLYAKMKATFIFSIQGINRPGHPFKVESDPLQRSIPELEFKPGTSSPIDGALNPRQASGQ